MAVGAYGVKGFVWDLYIYLFGTSDMLNYYDQENHFDGKSRRGIRYKIFSAIEHCVGYGNLVVGERDSIPLNLLTLDVLVRDCRWVGGKANKKQKMQVYGKGHPLHDIWVEELEQ